MTKLRKKVFDTLVKSDTPLSASGILAMMPADCHQATVYRALRYLEEKGYIDSFVLPCSEHGTEKYYTESCERGQHAHWFHCTGCHRFIRLEDCNLADIVNDMEKSHKIAIKSHVLYFTGLCSDCMHD